MLKISDNFLLKKIAGEYIIAPLNEKVIDISSMLSVNETGGFIWECILQGADSVEKIIAKLCAEYGVTEEDCKQDVIDFCQNMTEKGIIINE